VVVVGVLDSGELQLLGGVRIRLAGRAHLSFSTFASDVPHAYSFTHPFIHILSWSLSLLAGRAGGHAPCDPADTSLARFIGMVKLCSYFVLVLCCVVLCCAVLCRIALWASCLP
jgi:hypothetical protein